MLAIGMAVALLSIPSKRRRRRTWEEVSSHRRHHTGGCIGSSLACSGPISSASGRARPLSGPTRVLRKTMLHSHFHHSARLRGGENPHGKDPPAADTLQLANLSLLEEDRGLDKFSDLQAGMGTGGEGMGRQEGNDNDGDDREVLWRYKLIRSIGEECIQESELKELLRSRFSKRRVNHSSLTPPSFSPGHGMRPGTAGDLGINANDSVGAGGGQRIRCYDGFEPSGRMHIAQGVQKVLAVNRLTAAGCSFTFWIADWFAQLNNKLGGDLKKIQTVGRYFIEVWKSLGMDLTNVTFLWASTEINKNPDKYWSLVMDIARHTSLARINRCQTIMG